MGRYLIRRGIISVITLIVISFVIFGIIYKAPGDPLSGFANNPNVPPEVRQRIRAQMGLDDPFLEQYARWGTQYLQGNLGVSLTSRANVSEYMADRLPVTLLVVGGAYLISVMIAIPLGVMSALKQYSAFDQVATFMAFIGFSIPTFFIGIIMIVVFSVKLGWLPFVYDGTIDTVSGELKQIAMPVAVLALAGTASLSRYVRASMLEVINQDYVRTARAKGLKEQRVIAFHAMRNALIPVITIIAIQIPEIFGGAIITEQIFRVPGIGSALVQSIQEKDIYVIMSISMGFAILVVVFNVIADVLYALLDPRIKYS